MMRFITRLLQEWRIRKICIIVNKIMHKYFYAYILEWRPAQHCKIWIMLPFSPNWKLKAKM